MIWMHYVIIPCNVSITRALSFSELFLQIRMDVAKIIEHKSCHVQYRGRTLHTAVTVKITKWILYLGKYKGNSMMFKRHKNKRYRKCHSLKIKQGFNHW